MRLPGKTALVTGAASGIGREIALAFAREGARVVCADRDAEGAAGTADTIRNSGAAADALKCDVTSAVEVEQAVALAASVGDGLDIVVNGAGIMRAEPVLDITGASMRAVFEVNVFGLFAMLQAGARAMIAGGRAGRIINLASIAGRQGKSGSLQYCASKAAVISITQSAGQALAAHGIAVNAIAPGFITTPMWEEIHEIVARGSLGVTAEQFDSHLAATVAAGRLGQPGDLVSTALFLASDDAGYVIGQTINVDGGVIFN